MAVADQVLAYLRALAWPIVVLIAIVLFRDSIRRLLAGIEEFEGFGVKTKIRQQVKRGVKAAEDVLKDSPPRTDATPGRLIAPNLVFIISQAQEALTVSRALASSVPVAANDSLGRMRSALTQLDTAITAVLVIFATAGTDDHRTRTWVDSTPASVDLRLHDLTTVSGWKGVLDSRNALRSTLIVVCGSNGKAVSETESDRFRDAAVRALEQWYELIRMAADVGRALQL